MNMKSLDGQQMLRFLRQYQYLYLRPEEEPEEYCEPLRRTPNQNPLANPIAAKELVWFLTFHGEPKRFSVSKNIFIPAFQAEDTMKALSALFQKVACLAKMDNALYCSIGEPRKEAATYLEDAIRSHILHPLLEECWKKRILPDGELHPLIAEFEAVARGILDGSLGFKNREPDALRRRNNANSPFYYLYKPEPGESQNTEIDCSLSKDSFLQLEEELFPSGFMTFPALMSLEEAAEHPRLRVYHALGYCLILRGCEINDIFYSTEIYLAKHRASFSKEFFDQ